jgi:transposase
MKERIVEIVYYSGMSMRAFAKECGISYCTFYASVTSRRAISVDIVQKILQRYPEVEEGWLLLNRGEMLSQKTRAAIERKK